MEQNEKQIELDVVGLFHFLKKRFLIILITALVFGVGGFVYGRSFIQPVYYAETQLYVLNRSSTTMVQSHDFQLSDQILKDCEVLIKGKNVTRKVVEELDLPMTPEALGNKIVVGSKEETRVLEIRVVDGDPTRAAAIANAVCKVAAIQIQEITDADAVHQLYEAEIPNAPSGSPISRYAFLGAGIGLLLTCIVLAVIFAIDDSIRSEEDVERYLDLSVFGVIPENAELEGTPRPQSNRRVKPKIQIMDEK